jgi:peptidyl-prolyl cis-trans isomerase D
MIRFLQRGNRFTKALLVVVIGAASVSMVVYLIPGLASGGAASPDTYAIIYPHWYSRFLSSGDAVSEARVEQSAQNELQQRSPQNASNPMLLQFFVQEVGQQLVQQQVLVEEARRLGIRATDNDVRQYLRTGLTGQVLYPEGRFIGEEAYRQLVDERLHESVADFENGIKTDIAIQRLRAFLTAGVTVSDQEVRETYRKQNIKIKFDYAVISGDDLRKTINPSDGELETFFQKSAARYAQAAPEERTIAYFAFTANQVPGGVPQPTQEAIQEYYNEHQSDYFVPEQAKSRHILISVPQGADAKTDAAAKAKAEMILKQLQAGGSWALLAKKYSDDPGSKDAGGELGWAQRGKMVPAFDHAIFTQKIGDIALVRSSFGYHVVQVEARQQAHTQPLSEVQPAIAATLAREAATIVQEKYAQELTSETIKNGLEKTAAAHQLRLVTTQPVAQQSVIAALPDSTQLLAKAFEATQGGPPARATRSSRLRASSRRTRPRLPTGRRTCLTTTATSSFLPC